MHTIIFATNNEHKIKEIQSLVGSDFTIITLEQAGIDIDIPEPHDTLQENAYEKAMTIENMTQQNCFSEDTGLEIEALDGEPGVYSARYAGEEKDSNKNMDLVLKKMEGFSNRKARFKTVISLSLDNKSYLFEGIVEGNIRKDKIGNLGFGYDPIFEPENIGRTFAEMTIEEKNTISHRGRAFEKMIHFLNSK